MILITIVTGVYKPIYNWGAGLTKKTKKTNSTAGAGTWHRTGGEIPRAYVGAWDEKKPFTYWGL